MPRDTISSSEFLKSPGQYFDQASKSPVVITKYNRPTRVLIDIDLYKRIAEIEKQSQEVFHASEAPEDHLALIQNAKPGPDSVAVSEEIGDEDELVR